MGFDNPTNPYDKTKLPVGSEHVATGSTGEIRRLTYLDGTTRIVKTAVNSDHNQAIDSEYQTLSKLQVFPLVPRIYEHLPSTPNRNSCFFMEDLKQYKDLSRISNGLRAVDLLDTDTKIFFILVPLVRTLEAMNNAGISYNDVQLQNLMVDLTTGDLKIVDFGNVRPSVGDQDTTDVGQVQELILHLFSEERDAVPKSILDWSQKQFSTHHEGWSSCMESIRKSIDQKEIDQAQGQWRKIQDILLTLS